MTEHFMLIKHDVSLKGVLHKERQWYDIDELEIGCFHL